MSTATIQVAKVYPPKNGNPKASWAVVDQLGHYWGFYPDKVHTPEVGSTITVEWKGRTWNGKEYKDITKIVGDSAPAAPRPNGHAAAAPAPAAYPRQQTHPEDARRMWVCALVVAAINSGKVDPFSDGDLEGAGKAALQAHAMLFPESN